MRIQFAVPIQDRHGRVIEEPDFRNPPHTKKVTLADLCCAVLDLQQPGDSNAKEKARRWGLVREITRAEAALEPLEVLDEDVEMLKGRIWASTYHASICGYAVEMLKPVPEPATVAKSKAA